MKRWDARYEAPRRCRFHAACGRQAAVTVEHRELGPVHVCTACAAELNRLGLAEQR